MGPRLEQALAELDEAVWQSFLHPRSRVGEFRPTPERRFGPTELPRVGQRVRIDPGKDWWQVPAGREGATGRIAGEQPTDVGNAPTYDIDLDTGKRTWTTKGNLMRLGPGRKRGEFAVQVRYPMSDWSEHRRFASKKDADAFASELPKVSAIRPHRIRVVPQGAKRGGNEFRRGTPLVLMDREKSGGRTEWIKDSSKKWGVAHFISHHPEGDELWRARLYHGGVNQRIHKFPKGHKPTYEDVDAAIHGLL
jgi:hypothetical protein